MSDRLERCLLPDRPAPAATRAVVAARRLASPPAPRLAGVILGALCLAACSTGRVPRPASTPGEDSSDALVAVYRGGTVTRGEYDSMLLARGLEDDPARRLEQAQHVAVTEVMAAAALRNGAEGRLQYQISLRTLRGRVLVEALRRHLASQITVDEDELTRATAEHRQKLHAPRRVRLRNIFKRFPRNGNPEQVARARSEMARIVQELAAGADFSELATRDSDSQSRYQGGKLGLIDPATLDPAFADVARRLQPGETSPPIETSMGLTLLRCDEVVEPSVPDEETIRRTVEQRLRNVRLQEEWESQGERLLEGARIDVAALQGTPEEPGPAIQLADGETLDAAVTAELLRQSGEPRPPDQVPADELHSALRQLALIQSAAARAEELGLDQAPDVRARLEWGRLEALAREEISSRLEERLETLTVEEARVWFDANRSGFQQAAQYQLGAIVLDPSGEGIHSAYARAEALRDDITQGRKSFEQAAAELSIHPSAADGGNLGWLDLWKLNRLGPIVAKVVPTLEPGQISDVLLQPSPGTGGSGLWIVRVLAVLPPRPMSFEEAMDQGLIADLQQQRRDALMGEIWQEILAQLDLRLV